MEWTTIDNAILPASIQYVALSLFHLDIDWGYQKSPKKLTRRHFPWPIYAQIQHKYIYVVYDPRFQLGSPGGSKTGRKYF